MTAQRNSRDRLRRWGFRASAVSLVPLLLLLAEGLLRFLNFGYEPRFFVEDTIQGQAVWRDNPLFGWRFFPRLAARHATPLTFPRHKAPGTVRIFILGSSAAMGDPDPTYSFSRMLEVLLTLAYPSTHFEVINTGMVAINSHVVRVIAEEAATLEPDIFIVYTGNNEVVGPFGPGTVFEPFSDRLPLIRARILLNSLKLGQWVEEAATPEPERYRSWQGMKMFLDRQVSSRDHRLETVRAHYRKNLEAIVNAGTSAGAEVVLCTVGSNLRDCPPFASRPRENLRADHLREWERLVARGIAEDSAGRSESALISWSEAVRIDGDRADLHFRIGRSMLKLGRRDEALTAFEKSRDLDTLRFRADGPTNAIVRSIATDHSSRPRLVDIEAEMTRSAGDSVPGAEFFDDHVHMNFTGNALIARALAAGIEETLSSRRSMKPRTAPETGDSAIARALGYTDWSRWSIAKEMLLRTSEAPFTNQADSETRRAEQARRIKTLAHGTTRTELESAVALHREILRSRPDDWPIRFNLADILGAIGESDAAAAEGREVLSRVPHHLLMANTLGRLELGLGRDDEAERIFRRTIEIHPVSADARNNLGLLLLHRNRIEEAIACFRECLRVHPSDPDAANNLAWHYASLEGATAQQISDAVELAERACELTDRRDPKFLDTLAAAYASAGRFNEAKTTLLRALTILEATGNTIPVKELRRRLDLYRNHMPYRIPGS